MCKLSQTLWLFSPWAVSCPSAALHVGRKRRFPLVNKPGELPSCHHSHRTRSQVLLCCAKGQTTIDGLPMLEM